jgi:acetolactate synthase-1/2/3 large subunit
MGFGLPAAIGTKIANPNQNVVCISGDSSFQMSIQELGTISQYNLGIKIVIINNGWQGMVRQWQELFHEKRYSYTDITSPDFVQLAKAYNIDGRHVSERDKLRESLKEMLDHPSSFLLEVAVIHEDNVFPMVPQGKGVAEIVLTKEEI